jgi:hypothetical protein
MSNVRQNRRRLFAKAGILGALAALFNPSAAFAQANWKTQNPTGSWQITTTTQGSDAPPSFLALHTFTGDGTTTTAEQRDQIPTKQGAQMSSLASPGHGVWTKTGSNEFVYDYRKMLVDTQGNFVGTLKVHIKAKLSEDGQTFKGKGTAVVVPPSGQTPPDYSITLSATRI